jgi:hypothetical protein
MDRDTLRELTTLMPEDLALAVPKRKKHVAHCFCAKCARYDWRTGLDGKSFGIELGLQSTWRPDECDLCDFFLQNLPRVPQGCVGALPVPSSCLPSIGATERVSLSTMESEQVVLLPTPREYFGVGISSLAFDQDCQCYYALGADLDRHSQHATILVRSNHDLSSRMEVTTSKVDFNLIKKWLQEIPVRDNEKSEPEVENESSLFGLDALDDISLDVIDCISRSLVRLPAYTQERYVTLSYIWGSPSKLHIIDNLLSDLPPTIEDSITVCQKLGYRYLWVDRYCIPQNDIQERHRQVRQMGAIYHKSALTFVACAGSDPQYGLPGVSHLRTAHSNILIKEVGHIQRIPATIEILASAWAERGWTYQEALLSQARLYFTDRQVYYEDEKSLKCEVNTLAEVEVPNDYRLWGSMIYSRTAWSRSPMDVYNCIQQFSARALSFPSDAIDALQGIFAIFERKFEIRHVCRMTFAMSQIEKSVEVSQRQSPSSEIEIPTLQHSLLFGTDLGSHRCNAFPSWSWAGWTGVEWWNGFRYCHRWALDPNFVFVVAVELAPEHEISWGEFQARYDALGLQSVSSIKFISIQAYLVPILGYTPSRNGWVLDGSISLQDQMFLHVIEYIHTGPRTDMRDLEGCALLRFFCPRPEFNMNVPNLLVRNKGTHWERINRVVGKYMDCNSKHVDPSLLPGVLQTIRLG